jgi:hypothetical protein
VSRLPVELLDEIMDNLKSFKVDLASSSLVCQQWKASAQKRLLESLSVGYELFYKFIFQFVRHRSRSQYGPHVLNYVRELTVHGELRTDFTTLPVNLDHILSILEALPKLKRLRIIKAIIILPRGFTATPAQAKFELEELKLIDVMYLAGYPERLSCGWIGFFLNLFKRVENLEVEHSNDNEDSETLIPESNREDEQDSEPLTPESNTSEPLISEATSIESCRGIGGFASELLMTILVAIEATDRLKKIELDCETGVELEALGELLQVSTIPVVEMVINLTKLKGKCNN